MSTQPTTTSSNGPQPHSAGGAGALSSVSVGIEDRSNAPTVTHVLQSPGFGAKLHITGASAATWSWPIISGKQYLQCVPVDTTMAYNIRLTTAVRFTNASATETVSFVETKLDWATSGTFSNQRTASGIITLAPGEHYHQPVNFLSDTFLGDRLPQLGLQNDFTSGGTLEMEMVGEYKAELFAR
jgi:hypothetical protein